MPDFVPLPLSESDEVFVRFLSFVTPEDESAEELSDDGFLRFLRFLFTEEDVSASEDSEVPCFFWIVEPFFRALPLSCELF